MAVKRKVVGIEHWEGKVHTESDGLDEKKRRVEVKTETPDIGATATGKEEDVVFSRCVKVEEETETIIKVEAEVDIVNDGQGSATDLFDDSDASKDFSGEEDGEEERRTYEDERNRMLEENRKRMQELGLPDLTNQLCPTFRTRTHLKSALAASKRNKMKHEVQLGFQPRRSTRYSSKGEGSKLPADAEGLEEVAKLKEERVQRRRSKASTASPTKREVYTEEHIKLLGSYNKTWELFRDGHVPGGGARIYDSENGKTCHQCRQKTLGLRTSCSQCKARVGQFCGDCLFMRYGENVLEANANKNWVCPVCRGICNCSICRVRRGLAPTGNLFRHALAQGFRSVAHYLIMTQQQQQPGCEGEKVDQGGESKGVDQSEVATKEGHQKDIDDSTLQPQTPSPARRISRSDFKTVKEEHEDISEEIQRDNKAVRLEEKFQRIESESFVMAKVNIKSEINVEEPRGDVCKKRTPEQCDGLIPGASPLEDAHKKRKGVEGDTHDASSGGHMIGPTQSTQPKPEEEKKVIAPGGGALSPAVRCSPRIACLRANKGSVVAKEEICILTTTPVFPFEDVKPSQSTEHRANTESKVPVAEEEKKVIAPRGGAVSPVVRCSPRIACLRANKSSVVVKEEICFLTTSQIFPSEDSKPCREETLVSQRIETSAKDDARAKKLIGRTKAEVARERLILKGCTHLSSTGVLHPPTEAVSNRLRRKEAINYKRFL